MKAWIATVLLVVLSITLAAQGWSNNPATPNVVSDGTGEQVLPKIAIDSAGNSFITQFDNSSGGYQLWIKKLSPAGFNLFNSTTGYPVSQHPMASWLSDYDLCVDQEDNALVTFQDIRSVTNNVFVYKIGAEYAQLWGANGIALSHDIDTNNTNYSPRLISTAVNDTYVAWMHMTNANDEIRIQKINPEGQIQWAEDGMVISNPNASCTWPQLLEGDNGDILMKYYVDSGPFWAPTRHIYVTRITPAGQIVWNSPVSVAGGISAWNQIIGFEKDGSGGAVLAWYDDRNNDMVNEVYVGRITSQGVVSTDTNGSLVTTNTGNQQYNPQLAVDEAQQMIYVFYKVTDANQNNNALGAQKLSFAGVRQWNDAGVNLERLSLYVIMPHFAFVSDAGVICVYEKGDVPSSDVSSNIRVRCLTSDGANAWQDDFRFLASNSSAKLHYSFDNFNTQWFAGVWEQGTSDYDTYAMRMNSDGSLGLFYAAPQNLSAEVNAYNITLNWQAPITDLPLQRYYIYYNDNLLPDNPELGTSWVLSDWPAQEGFFYVKARYLDGNDSAPSNTVYVTIVSNNDVTAPNVSEQMHIYPNPLKSYAEIKWFNNSAVQQTINIYNLRGQLLEVRVLDAIKSGWNHTDWNAGDYSNGVYLICLKTGNKVISTQKAVIVK